VLLAGIATGEGAVTDVALTLALLAAFASFAFVKAQSMSTTRGDQPQADRDA
jgi:multicomponent Na+:H+ antiporter subunit F